ncbi:MAG: ABC transporter permease [Magnetococcales bacterium]|nr:ABC transporter permease [Magnetococcales bacterium]
MTWTGLSLAWRLLRSNPQDGWLFVGSVMLGVWILVGVALSGGVLHAQLETETRAMLAADIRVEGASPLDDWAAIHLQRPGRLVEKSLEFSAMARPATTTTSQIVEIKAVTANYPLRGEVNLVGGGSLAAALANGGAVVETHTLEQLHLRLGDDLMIGDERFVIRAVLEQEPDRVMRIFSLGPRVFIGLDRVPATNLVRSGSRVQYVYSVRLAPGETLQKVAMDLETQVGEGGLHILTPGKKQPGGSRLLVRFTIFTGLVTVMALLVGGLAVAGSVATYMRERVKMVAVLKCLGADNYLIMNIFFWQVVIMAGLGGVVGMLLGLGTPWLLLFFFSESVAAVIAYHPNLFLLILGLSLGIIISLLFALGPLWEIRQFSSGLLFRTSGWDEAEEGKIHFGWPVFLAGLPLTAMAVYVAGEARFALGFLAISVLALGGLRFLVWGSLRMLETWHPRRLDWTLAIRTLLRPESGSFTSVMALSLGVSLVTTILLVQENLDGQIQTQLPKRVPSLFFVDIQPDQKEAFEKLALTATPNTDALRITPVVRGRLVSVRKAGAAGDVKSGSSANAWRFSREYVLTWSATLPPHNPMTEGEWWRIPDDHGISVEAGMARDLDLRLGDLLAFDIQGIVVEAPVRSIRQVTWSDMGLNFFVIFSPSVLRDLPGTWLGSLAIPPEHEESMYLATVRDFPNVTVIRSREIMKSMRGLLEKLAHAVTALGGLAVISGLMVLWTTVLATRKRRAREGAVCRLLGATDGEVIHLARLEFALMGGVVATISLIVSQAMSGAVMFFLLQDPWYGFPSTALFVWCSTIGLITLIGWMATRFELSRPLMTHLFRVS